MRKLFLGLVLLLLAGCGESFDKEGLEQIQNYSDEIVSAMNGALLDPKEENANKIREINSSYWEGSTFMGLDDSDIEKWTINASRGGAEWVINGNELADALYDLEWASGWLADDIDKGELSDSSIKSADNAITEIRRILTGQ